MADLEFSDDLFPHVFFRIYTNDLGLLACSPPGSVSVFAHLSCHYDFGCGMHHFTNGSAIASTQLFQDNQVLTAKIQFELQAYFESICSIAFYVPNGAGYLGITV